MMQMIHANWPAPSNIVAFTTTRIGGCSQAPYDSFNLGEHVGDDLQSVLDNRALLQTRLPAAPHWLRQVHGNCAVDANAVTTATEADAVYTNQPQKVCGILTADCLPVLLCNRSGTQVAAIHGGWRGLAQGILAKTVETMNLADDEVLAWLGPAIGPQKFEVGDDVRDCFLRQNPQHEMAFVAKSHGKWLGNLYQLARLQLAGLGITAVYGGDHCTMTESELFYSFRRDQQTGRMASLIWMQT
jgi:YfiH family protein